MEFGSDELGLEVWTRVQDIKLNSLHFWASVSRRSNKYTSHEIQNEILKVMSNHILRGITSSVQTSPFITIMVDETRDSLNQEQATMVIRWVCDSLQVSEEFVGLYQVPAINADTLTSAIKDVLLRMNLTMARI